MWGYGVVECPRGRELTVIRGWFLRLKAVQGQATTRYFCNRSRAFLTTEVSHIKTYQDRFDSRLTAVPYLAEYEKVGK